MQSKDPGDLVITETSLGLRLWRITGIYIGALGHENVIGLESCDRKAAVTEEGLVDMMVPEALIEGHVYRKSPELK